MDSEEIKVEDCTTGISTVVVKQESRLILSDPPATQGNVIIQWNVEQMDSVNIPDTGKYTFKCKYVCSHILYNIPFDTFTNVSLVLFCHIIL